MILINIIKLDIKYMNPVAEISSNNDTFLKNQGLIKRMVEIETKYPLIIDEESKISMNKNLEYNKSRGKDPFYYLYSRDDMTNDS